MIVKSLLRVASPCITCAISHAIDCMQVCLTRAGTSLPQLELVLGRTPLLPLLLMSGALHQVLALPQVSSLSPSLSLVLLDFCLDFSFALSPKLSLALS